MLDVQAINNCCGISTTFRDPLQQRMQAALSYSKLYKEGVFNLESGLPDRCIYSPIVHGLIWKNWGKNMHWRQKNTDPSSCNVLHTKSMQTGT